MKITINGIEATISVVSTGNRGRDIQAAAVAYCRENGIEWKSAEVFADHGERGRCYTKSPGYSQMVAHG